MNSAAKANLLVACLCAEWCGTCRDYRDVFDGLIGEFAGQVTFVWVDIEDHDEVVGNIDVENFPTLLIARGDTVCFFGTVTPHAQTATRMVQRALHGELASVHDPVATLLAERVRAFGASGS